MSEDRPSDVAGSTPLSEMTLIDQVCDAFEHAWRQGKSPRIADYLETASEPVRSKLFEELLISDLEFLTRDESTINMQDYLAQFPERSEQIRRVVERFWEELGTPRGAAGFVGTRVGKATGSGPAVLEDCGNYRQLEEIARGGMGVVYRARDTKLQRTVALKMILDRNLASAEAVQRFYAEAEMAASLTHPGIVPIYDVGSHAGHHYYAMAYVEGPTLAAELRRRRFGMEESAQMILDLALAVAHAHEHGVVHRDLKPGNILLPRNGPPQITDFGLAKRTDNPGQLTMAGQVLGTPGYMAPEQAAGDTEQSGPAVDVYALGALLYHLVTGHPPFRTAIEALVCVLEQDPVPPRAMNRRVPRDLNVICMKCLSKNPADRYASAQDLADDLRRYLRGDMIHAKPQSLRRRLIRWGRHRPRLAAVIVTMVAFYLYHLACMASGNPGSFGSFHWLATFTTGLGVRLCLAVSVADHAAACPPVALVLVGHHRHRHVDPIPDVSGRRR